MSESEQDIIPEWFEIDMHVRDTDTNMYYRIADIATSDHDDSKFVVLDKIDNNSVQNTVYESKLEHKEYVEVEAPACPLCGDIGMIKQSNLHTCWNHDCQIHEYRGYPVDVDSAEDKQNNESNMAGDIND